MDFECEIAARNRVHHIKCIHIQGGIKPLYFLKAHICDIILMRCKLTFTLRVIWREKRVFMIYADRTQTLICGNLNFIIF